jgi:hypothetical protein
VEECLASKLQALSSNPNPPKETKPKHLDFHIADPQWSMLVITRIRNWHGFFQNWDLQLCNTTCNLSSFFFFWWYWGLNSGFLSCLAGESHALNPDVFTQTMISLANTGGSCLVPSETRLRAPNPASKPALPKALPSLW